MDTVAAGFDAFRASDQAKLENNIQTLSALLPTDETDTTFIGCSPDGYRLRRIERAKRELEFLDNSPAPSMGEEEKFVYFQQLVSDRIPLDQDGRIALGVADANDSLRNANAPSDFECQGDASYPQSRALDDQEDDAIRTAGRDRLRSWLIDLRRTYGAQLNARLQNAAVEIYQFRLTPFPVAWQPPGPQAPGS